MPNRYGVILLMFDLPVDTAAQRRAYNQFKSFLKREGYCYFHDSVYVRLLRNVSAGPGEIAKVRSAAPDEGSVRALPLSMGAFRGLMTLSGEPFNMDLFAGDVVEWGHGEDDENEG